MLMSIALMAIIRLAIGKPGLITRQCREESIKHLYERDQPELVVPLLLQLTCTEPKVCESLRLINAA